MARKLLVALAALVVAALAAEVLARVVWWARGAPYGASTTRERLATNLAAASGSLIPGAANRAAREEQLFLHPYFGWEAKPYHEELNRLVNIHRAGVPDELYVIVVLGGSVAGLFAEPDQGAPDVLAAELGADPRFAGRSVRVFNQGRGAFKEPQQLFVLSWLFALGVVPDAVINLDGFNDVAIANQNLEYQTHPLFPSFPQWGPRLGANLALGSPELGDRAAEARRAAQTLSARALSRRYYWSAILGPSALSRSNAALEAWQAAARELLAAAHDGGERGRLDVLGPDFEGGEEEALDLAIAAWREASLDLAALCRRRGVAYLHVLQPTLHDRGSKPLTDEEVETGAANPAWRRAIRLGYDRLRAEGERMRAGGLAFLDASMLFAEVEETLYYDACHFRRPGNEILARAVAQAFLERAMPR